MDKFPSTVCTDGHNWGMCCYWPLLFKLDPVMWNWSRESSNHGSKIKSYNKIALTLLGRDDGRFLILCFNLVKSLTRIIKICLASLGVWENILKPLGLGVASIGYSQTRVHGVLQHVDRP